MLELGSPQVPAHGSSGASIGSAPGPVKQAGLPEREEGRGRGCGQIKQRTSSICAYMYILLCISLHIYYRPRTSLQGICRVFPWLHISTKKQGFDTSGTLTNRVSSSDERHRLAIVHAHALENVANIIGTAGRVGDFERSRRVDVDEPHGARSKRGLAGAVYLAGSNSLLLDGRAELETFEARVIVLSACTEPENGGAHGLKSHIARQGDQVAPRDGVAIFEFDGLQEDERLVEVGVIGPSVLRYEANTTAVAATAAVRRAVAARTVPCQTDHERCVVAVVGRPEIHRVGKHRDNIRFECLVRFCREIRPAAAVAARANVVVILAVLCFTQETTSADRRCSVLLSTANCVQNGMDADQLAGGGFGVCF